MRTTIDLPDPVFRRLKARAALEGASLKHVIQRAVENELRGARPKKGRVEFPLIRSRQPGKVDTSHLTLDEILFD